MSLEELYDEEDESAYTVMEPENPLDMAFEEEPDLEKLMFLIDREIGFDLQILEEDRFRVEDEGYEMPVEVELETEEGHWGYRVQPTYRGDPVLAYNVDVAIEEIGMDPDRDPTEEYDNLLFI